MITEEQKSRFIDLACRLSPENLCCDGEISMAEARRKGHSLKRKWMELEKEIGRSVSEDEVWHWSYENDHL